jgi:cell division transport system permease protein
MMLNLKRVVKTGFIGFWRSGFVSLAAVLVMTIALFVIGSLVLSSYLLTTQLAELEDKVDINVYFIPEAPESEILSLQETIETLPEVLTVEYVSSEEALLRFRERHANDQLTLQALDELEDNPLGANLSIKAREPSRYEGIAAFLDGESALSSDTGPQIIDSINYAQNKTAIDRLNDIIEETRQTKIAQAFFLAIVALVVTFNTIRLVIFTSRDEISVMRLVGATNMYIRGPFVFQGIMYGAAAGLITLFLLYPVVRWFPSFFSPFPSFVNPTEDFAILAYYVSNLADMFLIVVGTGIILGSVSSYLAVRKYLRV